MSDDKEHKPEQEDESGWVDASPETKSGGLPARRLDLQAAFERLTGGHERIAAWLDALLSREGAGGDLFSRQTVLPVLDRLAAVLSGLIAMILVDRHYGPGGLGIFAWFFSLLAIAGYLGRYGIPVFVENRLARSSESADALCAQALAALLTLGGTAVVLCTLYAFLLAGPGPGSADNFLILLLGPTIFFQNINALKLAMLNGSGQHAAAAGLRIRQRLIFLAATLVLCRFQVPVPLLAGAFLLSQIVMLGMGRKAVRLPGITRVLAGWKQVGQMVDNGRAFLFTDNLLDVVFYADMLILGWFVDPVELGLYARALILARLFLVVPGGLRSVFRKRANQRVQAGSNGDLVPFVGRTARGMFFVHGVLAILVLGHFQQALELVYDGRQQAAETFAVFALVVPGLVFFSAVTALEPVFEALEKSERLKRMNLAVAAVNLVLNINLIPFAGIDGAAMATSVAMLIHFFLFGRLLPADLRGSIFFWPGAAAALYLTYVLMAWTGMGVFSWLLLSLILFGVFLWVGGFFEDAQGRETSGKLKPY
ncbi:lipopolysaccharide biosynthesis protein [uncultured Desulfosarcina sp.]|uniref:lipopolysaccharide biosynthesis protein n=1 Tax=uncultured Desulfosarcina sp. TaxID=218289 RepID=UPI0029C79361|nr:lipopolysaccharide biosynthesis protein [uncultured Desulfosarcina sp.]